MATVYVDSVADGLESVEGNTHRQNDVEHGKVLTEKSVDDINAKVGVFEI
jgi:hypothetical protein